MPPNEVRRIRTTEDRAKALTIWAAVTMICFVAGLVISLRSVGIDITPAPSPAQGSVEPRTVGGTITYVRVEKGGRAVACSSTYSSSTCSTVAVLTGRVGSK